MEKLRRALAAPIAFLLYRSRWFHPKNPCPSNLKIPTIREQEPGRWQFPEILNRHYWLEIINPVLECSDLRPPALKLWGLLGEAFREYFLPPFLARARRPRDRSQKTG